MPYLNSEDNKKYRDAHKEDARIYAARYRAEHPEEMAQYKRDWVAKLGSQNVTSMRREYHRVRYQNNRVAYNVHQREYRRMNSDKVYEKEIKRKFGMTLADKEVMWLAQDKKCKICYREIGLRPSHIDHIHGSDPLIVRGLLCGSCNRAIGLFGDSPDRLLSAAAYLSDLYSPTEASF